MRVQFKKSLVLEGVAYKPGVHEIPDRFADHWYILSMVQNGKAFIRSEVGQDEAPADKQEEIPQAEKPKGKKGKKKQE